MKDNIFNFPEVIQDKDNSRTMTTKEVAEALGVSVDSVQNAAKALQATSEDFPKFTQGQRAVYNEAQVATVKELAEELHVAEQTVKNAIYELRQVVSGVFDNIERNSQGGYLLNEAQATAIKLKLRERNNLKDNSVVSQIGNDLEFFALLKKREEEQRILDAYRDRRIAELQAENARQAAKIKEDAPKVEFFNTVADCTDCIDIAQAAKVINAKGIGRNKLFEILRKEKIIDGKNIPYQKYVDRGYFRVIESRYTLPTGETKISLKTVVFQKGLKFIKDILPL